MDNLKGKTILLGKEPGQGRLCVAVCGKVAMLGQPGSVPGCVSRYLHGQNMAHARIDIDADGKMTITNMKPANVTYVDDMEIMSKRITTTSRVTLGKERYVVDLGAVLAAAEKIVKVAEPAPPKEFDISHLSNVWKDYHEKILAIRKNQQRLGLMSSAGMLFTLGGGALTALGGQLGFGSAVQALMPFLTVIGAGVFIASFVLRSRDKSIIKTEEATEAFQEHYVSPCCKKFLGNYSYKLMKKQYGMQCPFCKSKFIEK